MNLKKGATQANASLVEKKPKSQSTTAATEAENQKSKTEVLTLKAKIEDLEKQVESQKEELYHLKENKESSDEKQENQENSGKHELKFLIQQIWSNTSWLKR